MKKKNIFGCLLLVSAFILEPIQADPFDDFESLSEITAHVKTIKKQTEPYTKAFENELKGKFLVHNKNNFTFFNNFHKLLLEKPSEQKKVIPNIKVLLVHDVYAGSMSEDACSKIIQSIKPLSLKELIYAFTFVQSKNIGQTKILDHEAMNVFLEQTYSFYNHASPFAQSQVITFFLSQID